MPVNGEKSIHFFHRASENTYSEYSEIQRNTAKYSGSLWLHGRIFRKRGEKNEWIFSPLTGITENECLHPH